ncbi:MAG: histidine phosphatase family protein [Candidatus Dojkabacteria bacterium]|nr:histidine phosphatase family protein [Candidatus Dojkabacteria bacterium]MDQ7021741.1 histidine phosphatase family protein [Candidatus Dojkabacteria bacterium]
MKLHLIRHSKTQYNLENRRQGSTDINLVAEGIEYAKELKDELGNISFDIILSSPLKRAIETAEFIFPDKSIEKIKLLREFDFGELEGLAFGSEDKFSSNKKITINDIDFLMPNEGDSFESVKHRCIDLLMLLSNKYKDANTVAIVTHSTVIEILRALIEKEEWTNYLGKARDFHNYIELELDTSEYKMPENGRFQVAVGGLIQNSKTNKILLLRRKKTNVPDEGWEDLTGRINQYEDPETALRREVREETGIESLEIIKPLTTFHFFRGDETKEKELIGIIYWMKTDEIEVEISEEHSEYRWVNIEDALKLVRHPGILEEIEILKLELDRELSIN